MATQSLVAQAKVQILHVLLSENYLVAVFSSGGSSWRITPEKKSSHNHRAKGGQAKEGKNSKRTSPCVIGPR